MASKRFVGDCISNQERKRQKTIIRGPSTSLEYSTCAGKSCEKQEYSNAVLGDHLLLAADKGDSYWINLLLEQGADPNAMDEVADTALHICLRRGTCMEQSVRQLVYHGADVSHHNHDNESPIHVALLHRWSRDIIKLLVIEGHGMNFDRQDEFHCTSRKSRSPLVAVMAGYRSARLGPPPAPSVFGAPREPRPYVSPDTELALLFVQLGASQRDLEMCLWFELNREEPEGVLLHTLMSTFPHLPSIQRLQRMDFSHLLADRSSYLDSQTRDRMRSLRDSLGDQSDEEMIFDSDVEGMGSIWYQGCLMSMQDVNMHQKVAQKKKDKYCLKRLEVPSLMHLTRCAVRQGLKPNIRQVLTLPIPNKLKTQVLLGYDTCSDPLSEDAQFSSWQQATKPVQVTEL